MGNCRDCARWYVDDHRYPDDGTCCAIQETTSYGTEEPLARVRSGAYADPAVKAGELLTRGDFGCVLFNAKASDGG